MSSRHEKGWDRIYHLRSPEALPWELGKPRKVLVDLLESDLLSARGKAVDLCCGAGTNTVYMAQEGFDVTALDISDKAIEYAKEKAADRGVDINFLAANFSWLPLQREIIDFVYDFGCFHHVEEERRETFIQDVHRILRVGGVYLMVCFSQKNGPAWNHFREEQIRELFGDLFRIERVKHTSSLEGDNVTRYFYEVFMKKHR